LVVGGQCKKPTAHTAHLVFAETKTNAKKTKRAVFCQRTDKQKQKKNRHKKRTGIKTVNEERQD
jgi:hypothetical protein